jgi:ATP-dependent Zn protease
MRDAKRLALLISKTDAAEILERARATAEQLVSAHRHAIFSLANQLYQRDSLTGAEVASFVLAERARPKIVTRCSISRGY